MLALQLWGLLIEFGFPLDRWFDFLSFYPMGSQSMNILILVNISYNYSILGQIDNMRIIMNTTWIQKGYNMFFGL